MLLLNLHEANATFGSVLSSYSEDLTTVRADVQAMADLQDSILKGLVF